MKRLLQELKEYKASSIKAPLFMIGEVGLELSLPTLMAYVIDNGVMERGYANGSPHGPRHAGGCVFIARMRCAERQERILCVCGLCKEPAQGDV